MTAVRWAVVYATLAVVMALIGAPVAGLLLGLLALAALAMAVWS